MGRGVLYGRCVVGIVAFICLLGGKVYAGDSNEKKADDATPREVLDCRYQQISKLSEGGTSGEAFPSDDLFRPLLADPEQPQLFALWQFRKSLMDQSAANIGTVGIGENFGFYTRRKGCNGWQIGLLTGIFSQFNLDTSNSELINVDFNGQRYFGAGVDAAHRHGHAFGQLALHFDGAGNSIDGAGELDQHSVAWF